MSVAIKISSLQKVKLFFVSCEKCVVNNKRAGCEWPLIISNGFYVRLGLPSWCEDFAVTSFGSRSSSKRKSKVTREVFEFFSGMGGELRLMNCIKIFKAHTTE